MAQYKTFTTVGDNGPWVSKLILELPATARANDVTSASFNIYVERYDRKTGEIALAKEHRADPVAKPSLGYAPIERAFVSDEAGNPAPAGTHVTLELPECRLTKRIDGDILGGYIRDLRYRVTQLVEIPAEQPGDAPVAGLVWDECAGDVCPQLAGWRLDGHGTYAGVEMNYGCYEPDLAAINAQRTASNPFHAAEEPLSRIPVLLWLHGAGEGQEPYRTVCGNKVVALGEADIQRKLGGAAYVLAPSSPTFWMDPDGSGQLVDDNQSCYGPAVKALLDEFIAAHASTVDTSRIYVGGLSNGGFMTCRMIVDYPGFFAAAVPVCAPWVGELATDEEFAAMAQTPTWWVQVDDDPLVPPTTHLKPSWERLQAAGPVEAHVSYYDHIEDETGTTRGADGRPARLNGHCVWINVYHDDPKTDLDGSLVYGTDGFPVTLWQWVGQHRLG